MDKLIYVAMTGAKHALLRQEAVAHNLANAETPGFRAQLNAFRATPAVGDGFPTRVYTVDSTIGADFSPGPIRHTGRSLDVAVQGSGWITVEGPDGAEAYTRNGSLQIAPDGTLQTGGGLAVLSDGGPLSIPPDHAVTVAADGTVSATPAGQGANQGVVVGRIKLVNPPEQELVRSDDGLFRTVDATAAPADEQVTLVGGALEGSNMSPVEALVSMVSLAREFEMQMKLLQSADANAHAASSVLSVGG